MNKSIVTVQDVGARAIASVFERFDLPVRTVGAGCPIPGTYWGAPEAGLRDQHLHIRPDTPVHSALHEGTHFVCMTPARRRTLDTDAGGDALEECAVCFLSILLAEYVVGYSKSTMFSDMDGWGYSFRLGSARSWFVADAGDARAWLERYQLITAEGMPTWRWRDTE
ncbi:MAG: hypothetical protein AAF493_18180 [Pseudomonadota bacterium]